MNSSPYEVIAGPFTAFLAAVGTAFPTLDLDPLDIPAWHRVGHSGAINYDRQEGVMVRHRKSVNTYRGAGSPWPLKNFLTEADLNVEFQLADVTLATYRRIVSNAAIQSFAPAGAVPGYRRISLAIGNDLPSFALLLRSDESPYQAVGKSQYLISRVQDIGSSDVQRGSAGNPSKLRLQFAALVGEAYLDEQDDTAVDDLET